MRWFKQKVEWLKQNTLRLSVGMGLSLLVLGIFCRQTQLVLNQSPSLGHKAFLIIKGLPVHKGDLVSFRGHKTKYFHDVIFTKRIIGVAGDRITFKGHSILVENIPINPVLPVTDKGEPLKPLKANIIPPGFVFVGGDHPRSFDSRYEEFGLVSVRSFIGRTFAVW